MMVPLWLASTVFVAQAHAVLVVTDEAEPSATEAAVSADDVASAIGARLTGRDVDVRTVDDGAGDRWTVSLAARGSNALAVTIRAPDARIVRQGTLSFKRRTPSDVASTVAIWAIEALTPVMPELAAQRPEVMPEPVSTIDVIEDDPTVRRGLDHFAARIGVGTQYVMDTARVLGQLELAALWLPARSWGVLVGGDVTTAFSAESGGAGVDVRRGALVVAGEWRLDLSPVTLRAHLGPMLRGLRVAASGDGVAFAHRIYVDPGLQASLGTSFAITRLFEIGVAARAEHYFAHPTLVVDGNAALDTGGTAFGIVVWLGAH